MRQYRGGCTMGGSSVDEKMKRLLDLVEIQELVSAYANTIDDGDFVAWQELFTDDGGYGAGADRVPKSLLAKAGADLLRSYEKTHHFFGLPAITIEGDEAKCRCPGVTHHVSVQAHPSQSNIVGGWLRLTFRRTAKGWKIVDAAADIAWTEGGNYFAGANKVVEQIVGKANKQ